MQTHAVGISASPAVQMMVERARARRLIPFVGAGISYGLVPMWEELLDRLWAKANLPLADVAAVRNTHGATILADIVRDWAGVSLVEEVGAILMEDLNKQYRGIHRTIQEGPWPLIVTTNWDCYLEKAAQNLPAPGSGDATHGAPEGQPVRYRSDLAVAFAELKAGLTPPRLVKLHGDFERGRAEFVLGHADYRSIMVRDRRMQVFMEHLAADYSLLFYGCSMTDPDLLAVLDAVRENLGHAVGPHFWVTMEGTYQKRFEDFLLRRYGVRTVACKTFDEADAVIKHIVAQATRGAASLQDIQISCPGLLVRVTAEPMKPGPPQPGLAVAISVATDGEQVLRGSTPNTLFSQFVPQAEHAAAAKSKLAPGGCARWKSHDTDVWMLAAQHGDAFGATSLVASATRAFLDAAQQAGAPSCSMPLLAVGGGRLSPHEALAAQLHAIGACGRNGAVDCPFSVTIHVMGDQVFGGKNPLYDVMEGRLLPAACLDHGAQGVVAFTAVHPDPDGADTLVATALIMPAEAGFGDLLTALGLRRQGEWSLTHPGASNYDGVVSDFSTKLAALDVTERSTVVVRQSKAGRG